MTTHIPIVRALAVALLCMAGTVVSAAAADPVTNARDGSAAFNEPAAAEAAGYSLLTDATGTVCIDEPGMGAMGIHYVNGTLVQGGKVDPARPQAVVYELEPDGRLQLVALEYVVIQSAWDSANSGPPTLFGEKFNVTPDGNRYGLPAFYSLHAWLWKPNRMGMFNQWNPGVECSPFAAAASASEMADMP